MDIWSNAAKVVERLLVTDIARADYLLNFPRQKELLELCREIEGAMWNVKVANDEDEHHGGGWSA